MKKYCILLLLLCISTLSFADTYKYKYLYIQKEGDKFAYLTNCQENYVNVSENSLGGTLMIFFIDTQILKVLLTHEIEYADDHTTWSGVLEDGTTATICISGGSIIIGYSKYVLIISNIYLGKYFKIQ